MNMRLIYLIVILLFLFIPPAVFAQGGWRPGEMEVRICFHSPEQLHHLCRYHFEGDVYPNGYGIFYLTPGELETIKEEGFDYEIIIRDLNLYYKDFWKNREDYHSYDQIVALADSLAQNFPALCKKYLFGASVQGRELAALKISDNVAVHEAEAAILFDGGIHGDEIGGPENLIRFARHLCLSYGTDPTVTTLVNTREIWIYYMVNPDGRYNMTRDNCNGVDLNRDFGYMWDHWGGSYAAYSQVESKALRQCLLDHPFAIYVTYHSGSVYVLYPWSYRPDTAPDHASLDMLAALYSSTSGYGSLPYGQGYTSLYPINGSSKDCNYGIMGGESFTIEISANKQPPPSQIPYYYNANEPAMMAMIEQAGHGIQGIVSDASAGLPVAAVIRVDNLYPVYTDPSVGDYHKFVPAGTHTLKVTANGYISQTVNDIVVVEGSATMVNIQMQPSVGHYAYKMPACRIPGNNFYDEGNTAAVTGNGDDIRYSIGVAGWAVIDMLTAVPDGPGDDIRVIEGDGSPEGFSLAVSDTVDGTWYDLGNGFGTTAFDLAEAGITGTRYLKITDDGDGLNNVPDAGFDLDAIEVISAPGQAVNPTPAIGQPNVQPFTSLSWQAGSGGMTQYYLVSLGTDNPPTNVIDCQMTPANTYTSPGPLEFDTVYFWRVDACNPYDTTSGNVWYFHTIRPPDEDWESGNFSTFHWTFAGDAPWTIDTTDVFFGSHAARSGIIGDNQSSSLKITLDVAGYLTPKISFFKNISSATGDKLEFYIDNDLMDSWSGLSEYTQETYMVPIGLHTFEWRYVKNPYVSGGDDCGRIDYIYFPALSPPTVCAGPDTTVCEGATVTLSGTATNYSSILWSTSGTGTFDDATLLNATYTPGTQDYDTGFITLTLTLFAPDQMLSDDMLLSFEMLPGVPAIPDGPGYVDLYYTPASEYHSAGAAGAATYEWKLDPPSAGSLSGTDTTCLVTWDTAFLGVAAVSVKGINDCGEGPFSEPLYVTVDNTVGVGEVIPDIHIDVFPNPSDGHFILNVISSGDEIITIRLTDILGKRVFERKEKTSGHRIKKVFDFGDISEGIYLLSVRGNSITVIKKIIVK